MGLDALAACQSPDWHTKISTNDSQALHNDPMAAHGSKQDVETGNRGRKNDP